MALRKSSTQPWSEKSPALSPHPRKLNAVATQSSWREIRSISCGNVPPESCASRGPIGKPWQRMMPGLGCAS